MPDAEKKPVPAKTGDNTGIAVIDINRQIAVQLKDPAVSRALLATTFKGLDETRMKQALLEGMVRGFKFQDFLIKDIYALPYAKGYSLVESIDYNRKIGMRSGIVGTEKPIYVTKEETFKDKDTGEEVGKRVIIISCEITVLRRFDNGYIGKFTDEVYFDEYYKAGKTWDGKYTPSMWDTKPRTMIAKVAEMHALRKACPEELAQSYIEEEMEKEIAVEASSPKGRLRNAKAESGSLPIGTKNKDEKNQDTAQNADSPQAENSEEEGDVAENGDK